jgi:hypothetical protein
VTNIESATEDTAKAEDEQIQESKGEYPELDTNTQQDSIKRIHPVKGRMYWLNI